MKKPKKKNPQDATLRNIRALKKRVSVLETTVQLLLTAMKMDDIIGKVRNTKLYLRNAKPK